MDLLKLMCKWLSKTNQYVEEADRLVMRLIFEFYEIGLATACLVQELHDTASQDVQNPFIVV